MNKRSSGCPREKKKRIVGRCETTLAKYTWELSVRRLIRDSKMLMDDALHVNKGGNTKIVPIVFLAMILFTRKKWEETRWTLMI